MPVFYPGGPGARYLSLFHDLIAAERPALLVTLGLSDGEAHFAFCQTAKEETLQARCVAFRRPVEDEHPEDDPEWLEATLFAEENFSQISDLRWADPIDAAADFPDGSVDLLLLDDLDAGDQVRREWGTWQRKMRPEGLVLLHGASLERDDSPRNGFSSSELARISFDDGIGLDVLSTAEFAARAPARQFLYSQPALAAYHTRLGADLIEARVEAQRAQHRAAAVGVRQFWFDAIMEDRRKAQTVMDSQKTSLLAMTQYVEQVGRKQAEQTAKTKRLLDAARAACRNKGRCFHLEKKPKQKLSLGQKVAREVRRVPRNFRALIPSRRKLSGRTESTDRPLDRYESWIAQHEPGAAGLAAQRSESRGWTEKPKISLLIPVFDPPANFLEALLASIAAQSFENWEACLVDGGSSKSATARALQACQKKGDERFRVEKVKRNLGIAENTNRALRMATGDFVALVDHDDLLPPFALYQLARSIKAHPKADIFYSDEDRLSVAEKRVRPFFKPEWSPELLFSFMYLGHLTAYRRDFVHGLGGFRPQFDLSQDYDFALRATEKAGEIIHIPHVLYHWREHPASGASGGKPEARKTNLAALAEAAQRRGYDAEILEYPTANRLRMRLPRSLAVSVIIPTDSPGRARACALDLPKATNYPDVEFLIVTNSSLIAELKNEPLSERARFVAFDAPFNFSAKCNVGARAARGDRLIFVNDDVEAAQPDWIENLIEPLERAEVGAVAPKLLYESGKIQHAGLVTGVRGLVGTAMHQWPASSTEYNNLAQSMRPVSALSAACLAMRRDDFFRVGAFDEVHTPIAHSDLDLCFKVREAGWRCVYTPFTTMRHHGHVSIGATETAPKPNDKSDIYLLQRWGEFTAHDPYFPVNMRDWLYADSPEPIQMSATNRPLASKADLLFVSHQLSLTGAPLLLLYLAQWCQAQGFFVTMIAPHDGPLRKKIQAAQVPLVIDPLIERDNSTTGRLMKAFDLVVANTVKSAAAVTQARRENIPVAWWVHETEVGEHLVRSDLTLAAALAKAEVIFAPSERTLDVYRPFAAGKTKVLRYGQPDLGVPGARPRTKPTRFLLLGSIEPRKGQDVFLEAIRRLKGETDGSFEIAGAAHDAKFAERILAAVTGLPNVSYTGPVDHDGALQLVARCDCLVCPSRDEAMPLTILEAMCYGKAIIATRVGGIPEYLEDGFSALLVDREKADELAAAISRIGDDGDLARRLGANARAIFEAKHTMEKFGSAFAGMLAELKKVRAGGPTARR